MGNPLRADKDTINFLRKYGLLEDWVEPLPRPIQTLLERHVRRLPDGALEITGNLGEQKAAQRSAWSERLLTSGYRTRSIG